MSSLKIGIPNYQGIVLAVGVPVVRVTAIVLIARQMSHIHWSLLKWIRSTGAHFLLWNNPGGGDSEAVTQAHG